MKKNTLYLFLTAALVLQLSARCFAQDCSEILKSGIFDFSHVSSENDLASQFLTWVRSSNLSSESELRENSFGFGIPSLMLKFGDKEGYSRSWKNDFANSLSQSSSQRDQFNQEFRTVNAGLVNAWQTCIVNRTGVIAYARRMGDSTTIMLTIKVRKKSDQDKLDTLKIKDIVCSSHLRPVNEFKGQLLSETGEKNFVFSLDPANAKKGCFFIVNTNVSGYDSQFELSPILALPSAPVEKKPAFDCEGMTRESVKPWLEKCRNGDTQACLALNQCFTQKASQDAGHQQQLFGIAQAFLQAQLFWEKYKQSVAQKGEQSPEASNNKLQAQQSVYQAMAIMSGIGY